MKYLILIIEAKRAVSVVKDFKSEYILVDWVDRKYPKASRYSWMPIDSENDVILRESL